MSTESDLLLLHRMNIYELYCIPSTIISPNEENLLALAAGRMFTETEDGLKELGHIRSDSLNTKHRMFCNTERVEIDPSLRKLLEDLNFGQKWEQYRFEDFEIPSSRLYPIYIW